MNTNTLYLPRKVRQPEPLGAFTKLCEPLVGRRVVILQKTGVLFFGRLDSLSAQALRLQHVTIKAKDNKIKGLELVILRCDGIEQIHEEVPGVADSGVMSA